MSAKLETIATTDVPIVGTDGAYLHRELFTMDGDLGKASVAVTFNGVGLLVTVEGRDGAALVDLRPLAQRMALAVVEHFPKEEVAT